MEALFADGRVIDAILALMALEAIGLAALRRWKAVGPPFAQIVVFLTSGAALMLALKAALLDAPWTTIALCLCVAFIAHGVDLALRWRPARDVRTGQEQGEAA